MKVLVTGSNGLLGHHVIQELLKHHYEVRIIVWSKLNIFFDLTLVEMVEGNFADYQTLKNASEKCEAIIHIAAVTSTDLLNYEDYRKINVEASAQLIKVEEDLKINTIVFISTANTIGYGNEQEPADERSILKYPFTKSYYAQSKVEAEKLFLDSSKKPNRHIIIINPTFILGAFDPKPSSGRLMLFDYRKRILFIPKGGKNFVAAKDVAVAACNALKEGKNGERYLASGVNLSFKEYFNLQKVVGSYKQFIFELPDFLLSIVGKTGDMVRLFGIKTELCSMNLNQLKIREYYSNQKAKSDLNLPETDLKITIKEAIDWFKENNIIDK